MKVSKRDVLKTKKFSEMTGKLHMICPHSDRSGVTVHVVIRDGICYRSEICMVLDCKYNKFQSDIERIMSITW